MKNKKRNNILIVLGTTFGLFLLNNILLGFIVPKLPGGSATGITTMFVITWLSLKLKQFGVIPVVFLIYGLIGLPSHLAVGDNAYVLAILLLVIPTLIYDWILHLKQYKFFAYLWVFPILVALVKFSTQFLYFINSSNWQFPNFEDYFMALLLGYTGIIAGYSVFKIQENKKRDLTNDKF